MGLDITAYSHLNHLGKHTDDWCESEEHIQAYAYDAFPESFRGIPILGTRVSGSTFFDGGCYERTEKTEAHGFRAGSYSGYGRWRDGLREAFNPAADPARPFFELIWFADNEGSIGPDAARDLLADFREYADRYAAEFDDDYDRQRYADWTRAFELAADGGLVYFH
ncbi:hypothetical protein O7626_39445 [Micromonospora sp. WMMD1102]|uniref:hypothetical protein n=1 Tax=Micromonospora sp. WMMD1102 TaxID=3016105 RepID=UPI002414D957|nr:hypothetical protein [Micromonospora sp. WMMD1102]MDG4791891.1 hypothetical protein [Micromonospora sp. WMMD1102]